VIEDDTTTKEASVPVDKIRYGVYIFKYVCVRVFFFQKM
jgi:hypothetical protein